MQTASWLYPLVKALTTEIFQAEEMQLKRMTFVLARENIQLGGAPAGFLFDSIIFRPIDGPSTKTWGNPKPALIPKLVEYMADRKTVMFDKDRVTQALVILLTPCQNWQDIWDALPNDLHDTAKKVHAYLTSLSRTRPEAWCILENPRAMKQYRLLRDKLVFYNISKLLY